MQRGEKHRFAKKCLFVCLLILAIFDLMVLEHLGPLTGPEETGYNLLLGGRSFKQLDWSCGGADLNN